MERLDKLIALNANISRRDAARLIRDGAVIADGVCVKDPSARVDECACFTLQGKPLSLCEHVYIMLNKPQGVVSSSTDSDGITVVDILPEEYKRRGLFPAGRLDKDTTGFCLITDDGAFAHRILSPVSHIAKTYEARINMPVQADFAERFSAGIVLGDGTRLRPAQFRVLSEDGDTPLCEVVITQGVYHQVKLMFRALGCEVTQLKRTRMGGLALDAALAPGECRYITPEELVIITNG